MHWGRLFSSAGVYATIPKPVEPVRCKSADVSTSSQGPQELSEVPTHDNFDSSSSSGPFCSDKSNCEFVPQSQMTSVLQETINGLNLEAEVGILFCDKWGPGCLLWDYLQEQSCTELEVGPWFHDRRHEIGGGIVRCKLREVHMRALVPAAVIGPNTTRLTTTFRISCADFREASDNPHLQLCVEACSVAWDVPYCDHFSVQERTTFLQKLRSLNVRVNKSCCSVFQKSTMWKYQIELGTVACQKNAAAALMQVLRKRLSKSTSIVPTMRRADAVEGMPARPDRVYLERTILPFWCHIVWRHIVSQPSRVCGSALLNVFPDAAFSELRRFTGDRGMTGQACADTGDELCLRKRGTAASSATLAMQLRTCKEVQVEIWELQRRLTLFHSEWTAPFLPHDGQASWRWCDSEYKKHMWVVDSKREVSNETKPPIQAPAGWCSDEFGWNVVEPPGPADADSWQYAFDFFIEGGNWGSDPYAYHCRRRLWRRTYVRNPTSSRTRIMFVWELQRRTTLFHTDWRAPFLPHDGEASYRWVDAEYCKHPCTDGDSSYCAEANIPAIKPPNGWRPHEHGWSVDMGDNSDVNNCDEEGWQYALDFVTNQEWWYPSCSGRHCRRRLWKIELIEVPEEAV